MYRGARAKKAYNTLQKVSTQLELPNLINHVCRNIAYFADSAVFRGQNVQKNKIVSFISLLVYCLLPLPCKNNHFNFHMNHLTFICNISTLANLVMIIFVFYIPPFNGSFWFKWSMGIPTIACNGLSRANWYY